VYDGDTPQQARPAVRERAQLVITNPDMLHQSLLPCHAAFARLLANLAVVVVDEVCCVLFVCACLWVCVSLLVGVCARELGELCAHSASCCGVCAQACTSAACTRPMST
jgi:DEAD/DEAH box helicase domain-containing protein